VSSCSDMPVVVRVTYEGTFRRVVAADNARAPFFLAWQRMRDAGDVSDPELEVRDDIAPGVVFGFLAFDGKSTGEGKGASVLEAVHDALSRGLIPQDALPHELAVEVVAGDGKAETVANAASPVPSGGEGDALPRKGSPADTMAAMERLGLVPRTRAIVHEGEM
jgi:hypothetical protein